MSRQRKNNYKFNIDDIVRYDDRKAAVVDRWWDSRSSNRYEICIIVGKNTTRERWSVKENNLQHWEK